jgi:hypothetical protein
VSLEKGLRVALAVVTFLTLTLTVMHREDVDGYQATHLFFMPRKNWEMDQGRGMLYEAEYYSRIDQAILLEEVSGVPFIYALESYFGEYEEYDEYKSVTLPPPQPSAERTTAYRDWLAQAEADYTAWFARTHAAYEEWLRNRAQAFDSWLAAQTETYRAAYEQELAQQEQAVRPEFEQVAESDTTENRTQGGTVRRAPHMPALGGFEMPVANSDLDGAAIYWQYATFGHAYLRPAVWRDDTITPPPRA